MNARASRRPAATVAVVSWNTRELLLRCLESLHPEVDAGRATVWVVDNGSSDGSPQAVRDHAPWAQLLETPSNLGFGRAVNLVAERTDSDWLACANADIELRGGAVTALLSAGATERVGCVVPRLVLPDGSTQHSVYPFPTISFTLAFQLGLHRLRPELGDRLCLEGYWDPEVARNVPWAIGAFLLLRRRAFDAVGGFDERQWLYAEDLDLGWRLHEAGWETRYEPRAIVGHVSGASTAPAFGDQRTASWQRATYAVVRRRRGLAAGVLMALLNVIGSAIRITWMAPLALASKRWRAPLWTQRMWLQVHLRGLRGLV